MKKEEEKRPRTFLCCQKFVFKEIMFVSPPLPKFKVVDIFLFTKIYAIYYVLDGMKNYFSQVVFYS
jgi:hypothetical protein